MSCLTSLLFIDRLLIRRYQQVYLDGENWRKYRKGGAYQRGGLLHASGNVLLAPWMSLMAVGNWVIFHILIYSGHWRSLSIASFKDLIQVALRIK